MKSGTTRPLVTFGWQPSNDLNVMKRSFLLKVVAVMVVLTSPMADAGPLSNGYGYAISRDQQRALEQLGDAFAGARYGWVFLPRSRVSSSLRLPLRDAATIKQPLLRFLAEEIADSFGELSFVALALDKRMVNWN